MEIGHIYIIWNESYGNDNFKCGYWKDDEKSLEQRYNTYYLTPIQIKGFYLVSNRKLAEKLLFHKLKKFRIKKNREFFCCKLETLKIVCEEVIKIINDGCDIDNNENINEDNEIKNDTNVSQPSNNITINEINIKKSKLKEQIYKKYTDLIENYVKDNCDIDDTYKVNSNKLYKHFNIWNKTEIKIDKRSFCDIIEKIGYLQIEIGDDKFFNGININNEYIVKLHIEMADIIKQTTKNGSENYYELKNRLKEIQYEINLIVSSN